MSVQCCRPSSTGTDLFPTGEDRRARIVALERQLAEAKAILSDLPDHSDLDAAVFEANALRGQLAEVAGKLDAVRELPEKWRDVGIEWGLPDVGTTEEGCALELDRILKGE